MEGSPSDQAVNEVNSAATMADPPVLRSASERRLAIKLSKDVSPISCDHNLLVGFHFGAGPEPSGHSATVGTGLDPISREDTYECWWYRGDVDYTSCGNARIAHCEDYAVTVLQWPDSAPEVFRVNTYNAYHELMRAVGETEHQHLVKIWNYFGGINEGQGDREKYRQFSIGRAGVFEELGILDATIPTGTAIGNVKSAGMSIIALTSKHDLLSAENPRQVSAFRYPRQYGPKSPKFSRGGCVLAGSDNLFVISGTAAIIGHESVHPYDVGLQTAETLENLDHLCKAISDLRGAGPRLALDNKCVLRVYLRDADDLNLVAGQLQELLGSIASNVVFLNANICRRELMVEIDGASVLS
jgi:chorismate lyase/3-hydroxybenzoate synthase